MESIESLLKQRGQNPEPPQVKLLKDYFLRIYGCETSVRVSKHHYSVTVPNGAVASEVRVATPQIMKECDLDKKLIVRINQ